jgi:hypothetical protein
MKIFRTAVLSFGLAVAIGASAEAKPLASDRDMVTGVSVPEADCRAQIGRLWVRVESRGFCVRFWLSTAGGSKDEALVAFHGDIGGRIDGKLQLLEQARSISDESLQRAADYGSSLYRGPYFLIARPGAFGSSGNHVKDRRTLLEIRVAMAALDALKQHYGFKRFHLVGQSGGGHTVAGLVQLRSDIGCAVITSGAISVSSMERDRGHPIVGKQRFYDPIDHVNAMKQLPDLRLFVVSDRKDKFVSYHSQLEFVERVKAHNLPITHVTATATDKDSHDLFNYGLRLAVDCAQPDREVVRAWATQLAAMKNKQTTVPGSNTLQLAPPASQPVGQPPAQSNTAQPANSQGSGLVAPVAQRVVLYDEDPSDPKGKQYVGSVVWRTEPIKASGNQKAVIAVRADIDIPDRKFKMTMSFRRNTDSSLPASHTAELTFILPPDFPGGGVANVPGILMKSNELARGTALSALAIKVTDGFFLVGLSNVDADRARNVQLLKERSWFDVPLVYTNKRRAIMAIEKGEPGERAFKGAFTAWGEDYPTASTASQPVGQPPAQSDQPANYRAGDLKAAH